MSRRLRSAKHRIAKQHNPWANYNGPGQPMTEQQLRELLAEWGIEPRLDKRGKLMYHREDFEPLFQYFGFGESKQKS